jgi:dihydroneopterin aldolase
MFSPDQVCIEQLEVSARVGVTESERAQPQRLSVSLTMCPRRPLVDLGDDIRNTIDYSEVCAETREFVRNRTDKLIETLADRLAAHLLQRFAMQRITIEIRKFVVPDAKFVAVSLTRVAAEG